MRGIIIDEPDPSGPSPTVIGVVCAVVGLLLIAAIVVCCCLLGGRRKRKKKEEELKMIELKTVAIEKNESDDDEWLAEKTYNRAKIVKIDKNHMRMNNRTDINSAQTLLPPKPRSSIDRPNNTREYEKPLLRHSKKKSVDRISNNLRDDRESGTEV